VTLCGQAIIDERDDLKEELKRGGVVILPRVPLCNGAL
jgi:hypothetical protein